MKAGQTNHEREVPKVPTLHQNLSVISVAFTVTLVTQEDRNGFTSSRFCDTTPNADGSN